MSFKHVFLSCTKCNGFRADHFQPSHNFTSFTYSYRVLFIMKDICFLLLIVCCLLYNTLGHRSGWTKKLSASRNCIKSHSVRGGRRPPSLKTMFKAFWLTLVDPESETKLKQDIKKEKGMTKPISGKGRSLKE